MSKGRCEKCQKLICTCAPEAPAIEGTPCAMHPRVAATAECKECSRHLCAPCAGDIAQHEKCTRCRDKHARRQQGMCLECVESTRGEFHHHQQKGLVPIGRRIYGAADRCEKCKSVVGTRFFMVFGLPVYPMGSVRYAMTEGDESFLTGRGDTATRYVYARGVDLRRDQVMLGLGVTAFVFLAVVGAIVGYAVHASGPH